MPQKKENLPVKVDVELQNGGTITYANEVIATIAGVAANEIEGIAGMCISGGFGEILSRNRNITRGVKVEVGSQEAAVDLYIIVEYGQPIQKVATEVQENVRKALESLTGLHVVRVDVHVQGVSFEKERKANQTTIEAAQNPVLNEADPAAEEAPAQEAPAAQEAAQEDEAVAADEAAEENAADEEVLAEEAAVDGAEMEEACSCCEEKKEADAE
ncbi:MAG: Asp23/Gls24 family envelope stress response protein [Clostridiales bacterium]|nr:Asp23/Gls24 family envelope stress response protein [Clostridiales bacterium]